MKNWKYAGILLAAMTIFSVSLPHEVQAMNLGGILGGIKTPAKPSKPSRPGGDGVSQAYINLHGVTDLTAANVIVSSMVRAHLDGRFLVIEYKDSDHFQNNLDSEGTLNHLRVRTNQTQGVIWKVKEDHYYTFTVNPVTGDTNLTRVEGLVSGAKFVRL
jgi:hypothetical protein